MLHMKSWSTTVRQGRNDKSVQQSAGSEIRTIRLEELNCDPIGYMAKVMMDEEAHPQVRFNAARELASYVAAKRKAVEITAEDSQPDIPLIRVHWGRSDESSADGHANGEGRLPPR